MTDTILVLTEDTLNPADVQHILSLHEDEQLAYRVLVPADTERNVISGIIDHLSVGELKEAWDEVLGREPSPTAAKAEASEQLERSVAELRAAGREADGVVVGGGPRPARRTAGASGGAGAGGGGGVAGRGARDRRRDLPARGRGHVPHRLGLPRARGAARPRAAPLLGHERAGLILRASGRRARRPARRSADPRGHAPRTRCPARRIVARASWSVESR